MKNFLSYKVKLYAKIAVVLLLSLVILAVVKSDFLDSYTYIDYNTTIAVFIIVCIAGIINGYVFSIYSDAVMEKPRLIYSMMSSLTIQLFIFSILYLFMDAVFDNSYALMPYNFQGKNIWLNLLIIGIIAIIPSIKAKEIKLDLKALFSVVVLGAVIYQMNYLELIFYGVFFGIIYFIKRIKLGNIAQFVIRHKLISFIVFAMIAALPVIYIYHFTQILMIRCIYLVLLLILCWMVYNSINLLRRDML